MAKNCAITIGVNHYHYLQRLKYAVHDADVVYSFFKEELGFHKLYRFTDKSPPISQDYGPDLTSQPTVTTLRRFLRKRFDKPFLSKGDNLWFFFAGHGTRHGNRDYIVPIDGDYEDLEQTAIPLHYVTERLQRSGADNIILLIDACRNGEGRRDGIGFGEEKQQGVVTFYSCSPQEAAYEVEALKGGVFTHVLLDSLRLQGESNCATVERLYQRLRHRVPQLARKYRHAPQTPYGRIEPPSKNRLILLPQQATSADVFAIKNDALKAQLEGDIETAFQLWIRVLNVSPNDPDAVFYLKRLAMQNTLQRESLTISAELSQSIGSSDLLSPSSQLVANQRREGPTLPQQTQTLRSKDSNVAVVPTVKGKPDKLMLLVVPEIPIRWGCRAEEICIYQNTRLSDLTPELIEEIQAKWKDIICVQPEDIFLPDLKFISSCADAIPGGLMPESSQPIAFEGEDITPLLPISSIFLEHLTTEDLVSRIKLRPISGDEPQVEVSLDLPLSGMNSSHKFESYRLTKVYPLKEENDLSIIPVLEIWPNFKAKGWQDYYAFFFNCSADDLTFYVRFQDGTETECFIDDMGGSYMLARMKEFPSTIECIDDGDNLIGLIPLKQPSEIFPKSNWKVGVDFGASFTNIYTEQGRKTERLEINELLLFKVTESPLDTRFPALCNYFIPERYLPVENPLPIGNILTTRGSNRPLQRDSRAILDGRIYQQPNIRTFDPNKDWIKTDFTHVDSFSNRLFLRHLILHISASAVKQGASKIRWMISYPSAFSDNEKNSYEISWIDLLQESSVRTGVENICSSELNHFRSNSIAFAQYFADYERADMVYSTCIDIGSDTSDISIWQDNKRLHQCSLKFAGRDLLSNILELRPDFVAKHFDRPPDEWIGVRRADFHRKLDVLLRWESERWLRQKRPALNNSEDALALFRLMAIGFGGLYYYVGLVIQALIEQGKYTKNWSTPVYLGGSGSRLIHWVEATGQFSRHSEVNSLLSRILSLGVGLQDSEEETRLSCSPKDEIACGLVLGETKLVGIDGSSSYNSLIPGEAYVLNTRRRDWSEPIETEDINSFEILNLNNLSTFLYEFHKVLKDLQIEYVSPLPGYNLSPEFSDNLKLWQGTQRSLDRLILEETRLVGEAKQVQMQPPFIIGLRALLQYLSKQWLGS